VGFAIFIAGQTVLWIVDLQRFFAIFGELTFCPGIIFAYSRLQTATSAIMLLHLSSLRFVMAFH
jgi:hypothetical protein